MKNKEKKKGYLLSNIVIIQLRKILQNCFIVISHLRNLKCIHIIQWYYEYIHAIQAKINSIHI